MAEEYDVDENSEEFKEKLRREREFLLEEKMASEGLDFQKKKEEKKRDLLDWIIIALVTLFMAFLAFLII